MENPRASPNQENHILETAEVFIVRIWFEYREQGYTKQVWRGIVEHLATKQHYYFHDLDKLKMIVQEKIGISSNGQPE